VSTCTYICIYRCIHTHIIYTYIICIYVYTCIYMYIHVYIGIYMYTCVYMYVCVHMHVCVAISTTERCIVLARVHARCC